MSNNPEEHFDEEENVEYDVDEGLEDALKELEKNWFQKASLLKTHLVSPFHDAAAKGNTDKIKGNHTIIMVIFKNYLGQLQDFFVIFYLIPQFSFRTYR